MITLYNLYMANMAGATIFLIIWYILLAVGGWKMFEKAGEAGWKALIPIYNYYVLFRICWTTRMFWVWILVSFAAGLLGAMSSNTMMVSFSNALSFVSAIMLCVLYYNLSAAYGHGIGYFIGLVFLTNVFILILGFGSSRYVGSRYRYTV